jgi:hypothetical protein
VFFLYAAGFVLSMLVARPFYLTFLNEANTSVALDKLVTDFDFMIFTDFFHQSQNAFRPFLPLIFTLGMVYLLLNTFFAGGILDATNQYKFKFPRFFEASAQYFGRFAMLLIFLFIFLMVLVSLAGMFFFIFVFDIFPLQSTITTLYALHYMNPMRVIYFNRVLFCLSATIC